MTAPAIEKPARTEPLTTELPDLRFRWFRAVRRDIRLTQADVMVLLEVWDHTDADGTNAYPSRERLAKRSIPRHPKYTDKSQHVTVRTVADVLSKGRELGYLIRTERSRRLPGGRRTTDVYRLALPIDALELADLTLEEVFGKSEPDAGLEDTTEETTNETTSPTKHLIGGSHRTDRMKSKTSPHQILSHQTSKKISEKISVAAGASTASDPAAEFVEAFIGRPNPVEAEWIKGEPTPDERPIHPDWQPNTNNRKAAAEVGVDPDALAAVFRVQMNALGERRSNWGAAFTAFVRDWANSERSRVTFSGIDHDVIEERMTDAVIETMTREVANQPRDPEAGPIVTKGIAAKLADVQAILRSELSAEERRDAVEWFEASTSVTAAIVAADLEIARENARIASETNPKVVAA